MYFLTLSRSFLSQSPTLSHHHPQEPLSFLRRSSAALLWPKVETSLLADPTRLGRCAPEDAAGGERWWSQMWNRAGSSPSAPFGRASGFGTQPWTWLTRGTMWPRLGSGARGRARTWVLCKPRLSHSPHPEQLWSLPGSFLSLSLKEGFGLGERACCRL